MNTPDIQDWKFGRLSYCEDLGAYCAKVEWTPGLGIDLCISTQDGKVNTIVERARRIFDGLRNRKDEYTLLTAEELLEIYIETRDDDVKHLVDLNYFIDDMTLKSIVIHTDGESELDYYLDGGPLLRVTVSSDLTFKEAMFD